VENILQVAEEVFVGVVVVRVVSVVVAVEDSAVDAAVDSVAVAVADARRAAEMKWRIIAVGRKAIRWNTVEPAATPRQTTECRWRWY
jgi:hypothetical protein